VEVVPAAGRPRGKEEFMMIRDAWIGFLFLITLVLWIFVSEILGRWIALE